MILYPLLLFLHIVAVISLFVGLGIELLSVMRIRRAQRCEQVREILDLVASIRILIPLSAFLVLIVGVSLCILQWSFRLPWIDISLGIFLLTSFTGVTITGRRLAHIHSRAHEHPHGPLSPSFAQHINDPILVTTLYTTTALLLGVLFLMTVKPSLSESLAVVFIVALGGVGASVPFWRSSRKHRYIEQKEKASQ